jgi:hypothetical protein
MIYVSWYEAAHEQHFINLKGESQRLIFPSHSYWFDLFLSHSVLYVHTVKKQRSINLFFSCMFRIERKTVYVGAEKNHHVILGTSYVELENFSFTFNVQLFKQGFRISKNMLSW